MTNNEIRVVKKNIGFMNFANAMVLISILFIIAVVALWSLILKKYEKAPLVIESDGKKSVKTYGADQGNGTYTSSGYEYASLGMPCVQNHNQDAVPNLPASYKTSGCNETDKKVCVEGFVQGGGICLSTLGGVCNSLYDCAPGQGNTICLNNVCVNIDNEDSINQPCVNDFECQQYGQNHICDPNQKICKYNYFPYESGCVIDQDCLSNDDYNNNICLKIESQGLSLQTSYQNPHFLVTDTSQNNLPFFRKNNLVSILSGEKNFSVYRLTSDLYDVPGTSSKGFDSEYVSGPILQNGSIKILVGNTGGQQLGLCVSKIPRGGKGIEIAGVEIPCDDGLVRIDGFCVKNSFYSQQDIICDKRGNIGAMTCDPTKKQNNIPLTCLGSIEINEKYSKNFNYTYPSLTGGESSQFKEEVPYLGYCEYPIKNHFQNCDPTYNNCKEPYLCLTALDRNGRSVNFCGTDFNPQECVINTDCVDGFSCVNNICLSDKDSICLSDDDCVSGKCGSGRYIYRYSIQDDQYSKLPMSIPTSHYPSVKIRYGNSIVTDNNQYQLLPQKIMVWSSGSASIPTPPTTINGYQDLTSTSYSGQRAILTVFSYSSGEYTSVTYNINLYPGETEFQDFLFTPNDDIYSVYSKPSETDRIRKNSIREIDITDKTFLLNFNSGYSDGDKVIYRNGTAYPTDQTYYLNRETTGTHVDGYEQEIFSLSLTLGGSKVTPANNTSNGEIWSVSNVFNLQAPQQTDEALKAPLVGHTFENGDMITLESGKTIYIAGASFTDSPSFYLHKTGSNFGSTIGFPDTEEPYFFYQLTDTYSGSQGYVSKVNGIKKTFEEIYVDDGFFKVELNKNSYNYSTVIIDTAVEIQYIVKNKIYKDDGSLNGINSSMSYNFDSEKDIDISIYQKLGNNYMMLKKNLTCGDNNDQTYPLVQTLSISHSETSGDLETSMYLQGKTVTTYFNFDYDQSSSPPLPLNLYSSTSTPDQNILAQTRHSPLSLPDENRLSIISTYENNQPISTNISPTTMVTSTLDKTKMIPSNTATEPPSTVYQRTGGTMHSPIIMVIENSQTYDGKSRKNTYSTGDNKMTFRDTDDIQTILSHGSSEIVLIKYKFGLNSPDIPSGYYSDNVWNEGQIVVVITRVLNYDVDINGEYLSVELNTPLQTDSGSRKEILELDDKWFVHLNNIYPVIIKPVTVKDSGGNTISQYLFNIFDASSLYTSTKDKDFFDNSTISYSGTSYNKLFTSMLSEQSSITSVYVNDGYISDDGKQITGDGFVFLPALVPYQGSTDITDPALANNFPQPSQRKGGLVFPYFYPINWETMMKNLSNPLPAQSNVFNGYPFIRSVDDYQSISSDITQTTLSYVRPVNSGVVWIRTENVTNFNMYAANNLFMSLIPRSITDKPYFNIRIIEQYYSILSKNRRKGSIEAGVNAVPYIGNDEYIDTDQSYQRVTNWPSWIIESKLVSYTDVPIIKKVFIYPDGGNIGGKSSYYVLANTEGKDNLYYFTTNESGQDVVKNQGVILTKSVYDGSKSIEGTMINKDFLIVSDGCSG